MLRRYLLFGKIGREDDEKYRILSVFNMQIDNKEIELKLPLTNTQDIIDKLISLEAIFISEVTQHDYLYDSPFIDFKKKDEALRLRHEICEENEKVFLTYKGPATFSSEGHKIREEHEVEVSDFAKMQKILKGLRFENTAIVKKIRRTYRVNDIIIAVDSLPFGDFIELEGDAKKSEIVRQKLGLGTVEPIKKGYIFLQMEWEGKNNPINK